MPSPRPKKSKNKPAVASKPTAAADNTGVARPSCPIVGIGASAGGLVAFKHFFAHMPYDSGLAFVLVPHLDPTHQSLMVELLSRQTKMPVCEARDKMQAEANHVYIIPPGKYLAIKDGRLILSKPPQTRRPETAIDHFLRSLAEDQQEHAIGIVLSGTSSHGTLGLQAIKANGGMTMAQQPDTADYADMPQNAVNSGHVDFILSVEDMPAALLSYVQHAYVTGIWAPLEPAASEREELDRVLYLLRARCKYDFRFYRKNMLMRRVLRRMSLNAIDQLAVYAEFLRKSPDEANHLFRDLLIGVTGFYRDTEAYKVLEEKVISQWLLHKHNDATVRVWIPGCSSGEEAYSIAMLLIESFSAKQKPLRLQIFATDIDEAALEIARQGAYPVSISADVSATRLARFFTQTGSYYQINKQVRDCVVFAAQNLISDAPFSKLDLISCRNLLIYLEPEVQRKVISLFHFALNEDGYLLLGSSETVGRNIDLFETVSKKWRLFRRIGPTRRDKIEFPISSSYEQRSPLQATIKSAEKHDMNFAEITQRQLLDDYAPASVLINRKYEVLYFQGPTGDFLEAPTGEPTRDLIAMARHGLQTRLRAAGHRAIRENKIIRDNTPRRKHHGAWYSCTITVKPILEPRQAEGLLLVTFHEHEVPPREDGDLQSENEIADESPLVHHLEYELKTTREDLQNTIEDMETSNEELKASNEEVMSMNEELQSANEELETSKEELQSLNEELSTVNSQLQDKVEELDKAHGDMSNLLNSADIATLFLDTQLCIREFTPATSRLLGLIPGDAGRPISTFATDFIGESLLSEAGTVLENLTPVETLLTTSNGRHYLRRILPYRTADNRIDGLVVTFIDITRRIESEAESRRMASVLHDSNDAITVLDLNGKITAWNYGAERMYGYSEAEALKLNITKLVPADKREETQHFLQSATRGEHIQSCDTVRLTKDGQALKVWIVFTTLIDENGKPIALATTERDLSDRMQIDRMMAETERLLRMVEHLPVGAVYREHDHLVQNRACEDITGYPREELATLDQWFTKLYGEQAEEFLRIYHQERDASFPKRTEPFMLTRKNGEQRYVEYAAYKFDDHEVWIMHDVSTRYAVESALRDREERLRAVMDNAAEAVVVISLDGIITDFNHAAETVFGYACDEAIGQNVSMLMPSPYRAQHDAYLARYKNTGEPKIMDQARQLPGRRKNGEIIPLEIRITQIDHLGAFVGIIRDLSEEKKLERQIAEVSTREQERIGQEIHDSLGQQLTGLSMIATSVKNNLAHLDLPQAEQMDELILQLQHAIKDARALSRGLAPVPLSPEGLQDALTLLAHDIKASSGIECRFTAKNAIEIDDRTTAMQVYRIAQEAVNNAVKHAHASKIEIILSSREGKCELTVRDNGRGFDINQALNRGMGLRIMRYRAGIIGCTLDVISSTDNGSEVLCRRPLTNGDS